MGVEQAGQGLVEVLDEDVIERDAAAVARVEDHGLGGAAAVRSAGEVGDVDDVGAVRTVLAGEVALDGVGPLGDLGLFDAGLAPAAPHRRAEFLELGGEVGGVAPGRLLDVQRVVGLAEGGLEDGLTDGGGGEVLVTLDGGVLERDVEVVRQGAAGDGCGLLRGAVLKHVQTGSADAVRGKDQRNSDDERMDMKMPFHVLFRLCGKDNQYMRIISS